MGIENSTLALFEMLLWKRDVKISHYTVGVGPLDTGFIYVLLSAIVCIVCPILLTIYGGELYNHSEQKILEVDVHYAKESVLVIYDDVDALRIFSTSGNLYTADDSTDCTITSVSISEPVRQIVNTFECEITNVVALETYEYFNVKMDGFSSAYTESDYVTQLFQTSSSSFRPSMRVDISARADFAQYNGALLPARHDAAVTPAYLPSQMQSWSPTDARKNHTMRDLRFDAVKHGERWNGGSADSFQIEITYEFPDVLVSADEKLWNKIKSYFIQLLAFLIGSYQNTLIDNSLRLLCSAFC